MRDDQSFDHENGAATSANRSDDVPSSESARGAHRATVRLMRHVGDLRSRSRTRLDELRDASRARLGSAELARIREWLGLQRPGRVAVAGALLCSLGLAAFVETRTASPDAAGDAANAELLQRAEADRAASRSGDRAGAPAADAAAELPQDRNEATIVVPNEPPAQPALPPGHLESGPVAGLSHVQMNNAKAIVWTGVDIGMPRRALVIAVATAMQESNLLNRASEVLPESKRYPHQGTGWDHDSVGLFQQRTSTGWGPVKKLMDPAYASQQFYRALMRVPGWQTMRLTAAAQAVQVSAFPEHYAKHEARATAVVNALTDVA